MSKTLRGGRGPWRPGTRGTRGCLFFRKKKKKIEAGKKRQVLAGSREEKIRLTLMKDRGQRRNPGKKRSLEPSEGDGTESDPQTSKSGVSIREREKEGGSSTSLGTTTLWVSLWRKGSSREKSKKQLSPPQRETILGGGARKTTRGTADVRKKKTIKKKLRRIANAG